MSQSPVTTRLPAIPGLTSHASLLHTSLEEPDPSATPEFLPERRRTPRGAFHRGCCGRKPILGPYSGLPRSRYTRAATSTRFKSISYADVAICNLVSEIRQVPCTRTLRRPLETAPPSHRVPPNSHETAGTSFCRCGPHFICSHRTLNVSRDRRRTPGSPRQERRCR